MFLSEAMFPEEDACKGYLKDRRWPDGVHCPRCGNPKVHYLKPRQWHWLCEQCTPHGYRFSVIIGTIFENTNKPLRDWFRVIPPHVDQQERNNSAPQTPQLGVLDPVRTPER
jgi:hypothetical protein